MRSTQVYRALDQVPNRFALCMQISRGVHLNHTIGQSMESSVTTAIEGIDSRKLLLVPHLPVPVVVDEVTRVLPLRVHGLALVSSS